MQVRVTFIRVTFRSWNLHYIVCFCIHTRAKKIIRVAVSPPGLIGLIFLYSTKNNKALSLDFSITTWFSFQKQCFMTFYCPLVKKRKKGRKHSRFVLNFSQRWKSLSSQNGLNIPGRFSDCCVFLFPFICRSKGGRCTIATARSDVARSPPPTMLHHFNTFCCRISCKVDHIEGH